MESFSTFSPEHADLFGRERAARLAQGAHLTPQAESDRLAGEADAQTVKDAGIFIKPGFFDPQRLSALGARIDGMIANRDNLGRLRNHRLEFEQGRKLGDFLYLDPATVTSEDDIARHCANVNIRDPLATLPEIIDLVLDPRVLGTATAYFGCVPVLSYVKVLKAFANDLPAVDAQCFHRDSGSFWIFKSFIYLNDVAADGGPFTYMRGSQLNRFSDRYSADAYKRYEDDEVVREYGAENLMECTADLGSVVFAETTGMHKGKKPTAAPRRIIISTFCVHREIGFQYSPLKIRAADLSPLSDVQRMVCDKLAVIE